MRKKASVMSDEDSFLGLHLDYWTGVKCFLFSFSQNSLLEKGRAHLLNRVILYLGQYISILLLYNKSTCDMRKKDNFLLWDKKCFYRNCKRRK